MFKSLSERVGSTASKERTSNESMGKKVSKNGNETSGAIKVSGKVKSASGNTKQGKLASALGVSKLENFRTDFDGGMSFTMNPQTRKTLYQHLEKNWKKVMDLSSSVSRGGIYTNGEYEVVIHEGPESFFNDVSATRVGKGK